VLIDLAVLRSSLFSSLQEDYSCQLSLPSSLKTSEPLAPLWTQPLDSTPAPAVVGSPDSVSQSNGRVTTQERQHQWLDCAKVWWHKRGQVPG